MSDKIARYTVQMATVLSISGEIKTAINIPLEIQKSVEATVDINEAISWEVVL